MIHWEKSHVQQFVVVPRFLSQRSRNLSRIRIHDAISVSLILSISCKQTRKQCIWFHYSLFSHHDVPNNNNRCTVRSQREGAEGEEEIEAGVEMETFHSPSHVLESKKCRRASGEAGLPFSLVTFYLI